MNDTKPGGSRRADGDDRLAKDWVTIWQSEMAALAADRESAEHLRASLAIWFAATDMLQPHDRLSGTAADAAGGEHAETRPDAPSRSPATSASPDARDTIASLERRVAELERKLAPP